MATRIYISSIIPDARAKVRKKQFSALGLKNKLGAVCLVDCYTIDTKLNKQQIQKAKELLGSPQTQSAETALNAPRNFNFAIEIGYLPGVTDNIGHTARETLEDGARVKFKPGQNVYSSQLLLISFKGSLPIHRPTTKPINGRTTSDVLKIANSLYNPLIQRAAITPFSPITPFNPPLIVPKVKLRASTKVSKVDLDVADGELVKLGKLGIPDRVIARRSAADEAISSKKKIASDALAMTQKRRGPLSLSLDYLKTIRDYFKKQNRKPTDIEIETLAQTWSEHCKHTIFADPMDELKNGIYKTYIKAATEKIRKQKSSGHRDKGHLCAAQGCPLSGHDFCVSVFTDNAGGIVFDKNYIITHKVETHNTPSALDPFGGAITGIGGVNRDALGFGLGAKPIINTYGFCLADPDDKTVLYRSKPVGEGSQLRQSFVGQVKPSPTSDDGKMLSARRIMDGVIAGINAGGNQSGIPTNSGFMYFDPRFRGKPLVFAGTVGLIPRKINGKPSWIKQTKPDDLIVMVGGRVGADGIHGATFSSESLDTHSPATAVQIGDPITQKKFSDALVKEARDKGLYSSITDCGAGGLSSAVGEMAQLPNGCEVQLDKVPLKYPGLAPWQIWISESQERMVLAVRPRTWKDFEKLMKKRGVEATIIGKFTNTGRCIVKFGNQTVLDLDMNFLHNGRPIKHQQTKQPAPTKKIPTPKLEIGNWKLEILSLLSRPSIASTDFLSTQYDHEVQAGSVLKPLQGAGRISAEATVTRPVLSSKKGVILSYGINPSYSEIDPYNMAGCAIDSAIRAAVAAGANVDYLALLDNFCWCSPEDPKRLWQLKEAARACYDYATAFGTPFISGKDSMYNDFKGFDVKGHPCHFAIPPTLLISAIGVVPDVVKTVSLDAKLPGDIIYILGATDDEMGGSEFVQMQYSPPVKEEYPAQRGEVVPSVNAAKNYSLYKTLYNTIQQNLIASSISVGRGGLAIALMKMLMGGGLGAQINLADVSGNWQENYQALFSESQGRILVTVAPQNAGDFENLMSGQTFARLGQTGKSNQIIIKDETDKVIVKMKVSKALKAYKSTFKDY